MEIEVVTVGNKSQEFELAGLGYWFHLEAESGWGRVELSMTPRPLALSSRVDSDAFN